MFKVKLTYFSTARLLPVFLLVAGLFNTTTAWAHSGVPGGWHMGRWLMGGWGMGWLGLIVTLLFWGLIVGGIVQLIKWLVQTNNSSEHTGDHADSEAMGILKERFARGDINQDAFDAMKNALSR